MNKYKYLIERLKEFQVTHHQEIAKAALSADDIPTLKRLQGEVQGVYQYGKELDRIVEQIAKMDKEED